MSVGATRASREEMLRRYEQRVSLRVPARMKSSAPAALPGRIDQIVGSSIEV